MNKLSLLRTLKFPVKLDASLEQYLTPPRFAIRFIEKINVKDKVVLDLGSGPGILGLTALLLGAKKVIFLDIDPSALRLAKKNYRLVKKESEYKLINKDYTLGEVEFINKDISLLKKSELEPIDVCLLNPPFGTTKKNKKLDVVFLKKAMKISDNILTMHKTASKEFILKILSDKDMKLIYEEYFLFPIPKQQKYHTEDVKSIEVTLFIAKKSK